MKNFVNVKLSSDNLDTFHTRHSIFEALKTFLPHMQGNLLDVGCGKMPYKQYILENSEISTYTGLDIEGALQYDKNISADILWDGVKMPIEGNSYKTIIATEVLEHCFEPEVILKEVYRVLKPGGFFFFTVPFLWNLHEVPHDAYRYTPYALRYYLEKANFEDIKIFATGGWHASMAQMLGLWVKRSPLSNRKKKLLSFFIKPIIKKLIKKDQAKKVVFKNGQMLTGLYGVVKKQK